MHGSCKTDARLSQYQRGPEVLNCAFWFILANLVGWFVAKSPIIIYYRIALSLSAKVLARVSLMIETFSEAKQLLVFRCWSSSSLFLIWGAALKFRHLYFSINPKCFECWSRQRTSNASLQTPAPPTIAPLCTVAYQISRFPTDYNARLHDRISVRDNMLKYRPIHKSAVQWANGRRHRSRSRTENFIPRKQNLNTPEKKPEL